MLLRVPEQKINSSEGAPGRNFALSARFAKNLLMNRIPLTPEQKRIMCIYKRAIRYLASRNNDFKEKLKKVLKRGIVGKATCLMISYAVPWFLSHFGSGS